MFMATYIKSVIKELKKVTWPTSNETWQKTMIVIGVAIFFGILFYGISTGTIWIFREAFDLTGK